MVPQTANMDEVIDKIDMSLDDIIKLNKEEQNKAAFNGGAQTNSFQWFQNKWGSRQATDNGIQGRKNGTFGVKTGLALRKMNSWKGVSPLNRPPLSLRNSEGQWSPFRRRTNLSRRLGFVPSTKRNYFHSSYTQASTFRRGLRTNQQRDQRQATYFQKRGIKVQATMDVEQLEELPELTRTHPWRTSMNSSGILTVSIDNPTAALLPSTRLPRPPLPFLLKKEGSEPKIPKGVPLDFDINSVVKQTGITLNERFKILKEQRLSQSMSKGSRFVTVG
ncbi:UAP56-interacting factor [Rana temporaria]|uniref:UAP56-interacting factor n=1 Tax=Rana temporaria TaxID=8407 RepID=UPI001AAD93A2|nr:UAP56-interacting factor [Rana temporaria]